MNLSDQTSISAATSGESMPLVIPFNQLHISSMNTAPTRHPRYNVECRAASIKAHGLLNALTVINEPLLDSCKKYGVVAGAGRYLSIELLVQSGEVPEDYPVKCELRPEEEAIALSLAENMNRTEVHEADEFVAFKKLSDQGRAVENIAAHFGIPVRTVQQRLRLAVLNPELINAYRRGEMSAELVRAFCRSSDQERQLQVWNSLPQYNRTAWHVKNCLSQDSVGPDDKLACFVGLEAYREAGGSVTADLFAERDEVRIDDLALLHQLAVEKMQRTAADIVAKEGWSWFDVVETFTHSHRSQFHIASFERREPSAEEQTELTRLGERRAELVANLDTLSSSQEQRDEGIEGEGERSDSAGVVVDELAEQIDSLKTQLAEVNAMLLTVDKLLLVYADNVLARGGVIVSLDQNGALVVTRGLIKPDEAEDRHSCGTSPTASGAAVAGPATVSGPAGEALEVPKKARPEVSEKLAFQLSAHRTAIMQAAMINNPAIALAAAVHRMLGLIASGVRWHSEEDPVKISATSSIFNLENKAPDLKGSRASEEVHARIAAWRDRMPADRKGEWAWLLSLPPADLSELFGLCIALSLDATTGAATKQPGAELAAALKIDVSNYWRATEASYFGSVSKEKIIAAVEEACGPGSGMPMVNMKKGDAAKYAEKKLVGTRWLPPMLRKPAAEVEASTAA